MHLFPLLAAGFYGVGLLSEHWENLHRSAHGCPPTWTPKARRKLPSPPNKVQASPHKVGRTGREALGSAHLLNRCLLDFGMSWAPCKMPGKPGGMMNEVMMMMAANVLSRARVSYVPHVVLGTSHVLACVFLIVTLGELMLLLCVF